MRLEVIPDLWETNDPNAWMVYAQHPEGGAVILTSGTKEECQAFAAQFLDLAAPFEGERR